MNVLFIAIDNKILFWAFQWWRKPISAYLFAGDGWFLVDVGAHPLSESFFLEELSYLPFESSCGGISLESCFPGSSSILWKIFMWKHVLIWKALVESNSSFECLVQAYVSFERPFCRSLFIHLKLLAGALPSFESSSWFFFFFLLKALLGSYLQFQSSSCRNSSSLKSSLERSFACNGIISTI